jgi:steroid 5-alpha reductase family enzyme
MSPLAMNLAVSACAALAVVLTAFVFGVVLGRHRGVDVAWGLGFVAVAVTTYLLSAGDGDPVRRAVVTALTVVWGLRLAAHIAWRGWGHGEDRRYERPLAHAPGNRHVYALGVVYLLQGALIWFISLPVQVAQYSSAPADAWLAVGVAVWLVGFGFETVGDAQLLRFTSDPANAGRVLDTGLWRYTRHPNYFGDACVWWGLYLLAATSGGAGAATILSPLLMTWFLAAKTGKPLLEASLLQRRPGYADYVNRTSGFIPLPPRSP